MYESAQNALFFKKKKVDELVDELDELVDELLLVDELVDEPTVTPPNR